MGMSVIGLLVGGLSVLTGGAAAGVYGLTVKAQRPRLIPNETKPTVPFEEVEWLSSGMRVKGWLLKHPSPNAGENRSPVTIPVIVIAHGWGSNRSRVLRYALPLYEEGYAILMYDARSHGESEYYRTPTGLQFRDDLMSAIEWLLTRAEVDPARIGVLGHSLGAFGAVLALDAKTPIAALVTDAMPVRFATMIAAELRRRGLPRFPLAHLLPRMMVWRSRIPGAMMRRANPAAILADQERSRHTPVLLIHSLLDRFIPSSELRHVLSLAPNLPHLFVSSEGHSSSDRDPAFWPTVKTFFESVLQKK
jgi:uncharacterized protein